MSENQELDQQPVSTRTRRLSSNVSSDTVGSVEETNLRSSTRLLNDRIRFENHNTSLLKPRSSQSVSTDDIMKILEKDPTARSASELKKLEDWSYLVPAAESRLKAKLARSVLEQRAIETEESMESIDCKTSMLAQLIRDSKYIVIYTGAGISTSASIPDYRGPNGLWTQIRKTGTFSMTKIYDLSMAEPTYTHMAIRELCARRVVNHVVSQNCDGLHLRSGIPQSQLSEIHGNMYIEVCPTCERQYFRQADITEKTSRFRHKTGRTCHTCPEPNNNLIDTIVLYGERSRSKWPMNWERASKAARRADLIICMGSSLKTLRRYECLWPKKLSSSNGAQNVRDSDRTKLVIVNLQYTSKDKSAVLKINGKCDLVMQLVMQKLNLPVPNYERTTDPLQRLAVPFSPEERANLKRNLIFEAQQAPPPRSSSATKGTSSSPTTTSAASSHSPTGTKRPASELSRSPSLYVSEISDDPERKKVKMKIRAANLGENDSSGSSVHANESALDMTTIKQEPREPLEHKDEAVDMSDNKISFALPGWLGKSIGGSRSSSYRRKRHGNKGRRQQAQAGQATAELSPAADGDGDARGLEHIIQGYTGDADEQEAQDGDGYVMLPTDLEHRVS